VKHNGRWYYKITRLAELLPWRYAALAAQQATQEERQSTDTGRLRRTGRRPRSGGAPSRSAPIPGPSSIWSCERSRTPNRASVPSPPPRPTTDP